MNAPEQSTPQKFSEEWAVVVDKDTFKISGEELKLLKQATMSNQRGLIWFGDFAISIPHIKAIYLVSRKNNLQLEAPKPTEWTEQKEQAAKKRLAELREKFGYNHD